MCQCGRCINYLHRNKIGIEVGSVEFTERRIETSKIISCIMEVIGLQFAEYIQLPLRHVTKQRITMHNVFRCTFSRINCIVHNVRQLSVKFREMPRAIQALLQSATVTCL